MNGDARPDPDLLLKRVNAEAERARRAKLKIFFGFAPGVGKTFAMLESAQRLRAEGVDVVVGCVETHGRKETAELALGLEVIAMRRVSYRGTELEEFDLEAAIARRPAVLLLDELAHTNVPGMRHTKRHQDVLDLLSAGIDVHTTLNVQHVESLNDVVAQVTTVRVRETVPDAILDRADEVELVDIPPDELLSRLRDGKVYVPDRAERAAQNFFRRGNLLALRELALRRTADRVDADVQAYREEHAIEKTWAAAERILVCVGPAPASARLVRAARRMAAGLRAPWVAVYVELSTVAPFSEQDRARLEAHVRLAESLGGEVVALSGPSVSVAVLAYARKHNVTRLIIGKPTHPRWRDLVRGSVLDEIVRGSGDIDVHVISGDVGESPPKSPAKPSASARETRGFAFSLAMVAVATGASGFLRAVLGAPDIVMLYLLVIMVVAVRYGRGPSVLASALSVAAYDFFFVAPFFTFAVSETRNLLTFAMMFGVGVFTSGMMLRIRSQEQNARAREAKTAALYALSRELASTRDDVQVAEVLARHSADLFRSGAVVLARRDNGTLERVAKVGEIPFEIAEFGVARWVLEHGRPAGRGTDTLPGARVTCVPLVSGPNVLGVLAMANYEGGELHLYEREFLDAFVRQAAVAMERAHLDDTAKAASLRARTEEMRSSLLSAVSHDLRTPLASITGAATTLRDSSDSLADPQKADLVAAICEEAERLERLVTNLLDMTRLESRSLEMKRDWIPLEEMIGSAIERLDAKLVGRDIETELAPDLPLVSVDPVLFEQVLVNLLENAAKYTPAGSPIEIRANRRATNVVLEVADHGPGIPAGSEERIFEKFHRGEHVAIGGVGLGLSICRAVVEAHGGTIEVKNRAEGGARFVIVLPAERTPPSVPDRAPSAPMQGRDS